MAKVTITIDGESLQVEEGSTILQAAQRLGIEIPTLCFVDGFEPVASCFVCAVQVEGRPNLSPSCAMPVADGMKVATKTDDVRAARRMALELLLSDHAGDCVAPCRATCPAGLDIPSFTFRLAAGQPRPALEVIFRHLALPRALGQVCPRLCEDKCRRCELDESVSIGALHRFVADQDLQGQDPYLPPRSPSSGRRVAIVGAGPAGLAAAFFLSAKGHACTLFEAQPAAGGMLRYGIPEYRLPKAQLDAEIDLVLRMGADIQFGQRWGTDFTLAELRGRYDAVFLAIGASGSANLGCEGEPLALSGIELLERVAKGERPELGDEVIVVGGGNTAMDACRTAVRLGAGKVSVLYRRTRKEMPCLMEEVEGAEEEGVRINYLVAPTKLERLDSGRLRMTCVRMELGEPDASGRRRPMPIEGSQTAVEAATVIAAIGQRVELALAEREGLEATRWGIAADPRSLATNLDGVFAGGDAVSGPDLAVRAVAAGRVAAVSIDQYLSRQPVRGEKTFTNVLMRGLDEQELAALFRRIEKSTRIPGPQLDQRRRRTTFEEIEAVLSDQQAVREAQRCLTCGCRKADGCRVRQYATDYQADPYRFQGERRRFAQDLSHPDIIYEPGKCIMCDACVRVAAEAHEQVGLTLIGRGFQVAIGVPFQRQMSDALRLAARRAAEVCPTGALALRSLRACDLCGSCALAEAAGK